MLPIPFPSVDQFLELMQSDEDSRSDQTAPGVASLLPRLRAAHKAVAFYAPAGLCAVTPPWPGRALAFAAHWPDGRTLTIATREQVATAGRLDSVVTLTLAGAAKASVLTAHERLGAAVATCLGPLPEG
ncbi:MAG TPA: hypothetical protein VF690_17240 [Hymenobacter sp.]|jgi:hypothetical protein